MSNRGDISYASYLGAFLAKTKFVIERGNNKGVYVLIQSIKHAESISNFVSDEEARISIEDKKLKVEESVWLDIAIHKVFDEISFRTFEGGRFIDFFKDGWLSHSVAVSFEEVSGEMIEQQLKGH